MFGMFPFCNANCFATSCARSVKLKPPTSPILLKSNVSFFTVASFLTIGFDTDLYSSLPHDSTNTATFDICAIVHGSSVWWVGFSALNWFHTWVLSAYSSPLRNMLLVSRSDILPFEDRKFAIFEKA